MTIGLFATPLQMLFSLLMMQGLSLTMFRTFLNQAIPRFDPMRFQLSVGNLGTTTTPAPITDAQNNVFPFLQLLAPFLMQQQLQRAQQMQSFMAPNGQQSNQPQSAPVGIGLPSQPNQNQPLPQVIIVPQMVPQSTQTSNKGSASTHIPVQVEPPDREVVPVRVTKRMLLRPPKTTRRPKEESKRMEKRVHSGPQLLFATPKAPEGFRRVIIPPVTANIYPKPNPTISTESIEKAFSKTTKPYISSTQTTTSATSTDADADADDDDDYDYEEELTTVPIDQNSIDLDGLTTTSSSGVMTTTGAPETTTLLDPNLLNHNSSETKINSTLNITDILTAMNDLIHEDFVQYINDMSKSDPMHSNQSPDIYYDNSKSEQRFHTFKRVCYYLLKAKDANLKISDIDPFICSHLIVGFASISANDLLVPRDPTEDTDKYRDLSNLKAVNRNLKVMLSVGDRNGYLFSKIASNEKSRDTFVASVIDICDQFGFDGIDIDWEFPHFSTGSKKDKKYFILLLKEIRQEAINRSIDNFIISATVGTPLVIAMASYDIPLIADVVDFVNLMTYDLNVYRSDRPYTSHHSPLYPRPTEKGYFLTLNAAWSATYWANKGMPLHKIILGVPTYARTYSLAVPISQGLDVPATGPGLGGGKLNYTSVCHFLSSGATKEFDIYSQVPFCYKGYDWIAYENEISVALKAQWVVKANMGGVMTFALNFDDIKGECREDRKKFPLQKAISNLLELASVPTYRQNSYSSDLKQYLNKD